MNSNKNKIILNTIVASLFWIIVWYIIAVIVNKQVLVVSPFSVIKRILEFFGEKNFYLSVIASLLRIMIGFLAGVIVGFLLSLATYFTKSVGPLVSPLLAVVRATPVASFIILALVWISKNNIPSFITFLMVLPIVYGNMLSGLKQTDYSLVEMARVYSVPKHKIIKNIYLPSVMSYFLASIKTSLGLGWKAGIAAEVLCTPKLSIGAQLYSSKIYLETVDLFAWTAVIIILSFVIEKLIFFILTLILGKKITHPEVA